MVENKKSSQISGFYKLPVNERIKVIKKFANLDNKETKLLSSCLDTDIANRMIENVLGSFEIPLGIAVNFKINEEDYHFSNFAI